MSSTREIGTHAATTRTRSQRLGLAPRTCPECGAAALGDEPRCPQCASPLDVPANARSRKSGPALLAARGVHKSYRKGRHVIPVLRGVDFEVREGEFTAIVGQSGSGKSTLLHLLGTLDLPDKGEILFEGNRIDDLKQVSRDILRNHHFGMIFQFYHLLPELTTLENVLVPRMIAQGVLSYWWNKRRQVALAKELLELVGLSHRLTHKPRELSGGEMQRAAIARALISKPRLLLADEPTGNLDSQTGREILAILRRLNQEQSLTIVMVTHDQSIAAQAHAVVRLVEGRVETERTNR
jgi:lipoprotein-releasing system ATP-binding protein